MSATPQTDRPARISLRDGHVDLDRGVVERDGYTARLTALERRLLMRLGESGGEVVDRRSLLEDVWEIDPLTLTRAVDSTVRRLRVKIEVDPSEPVHLLKVHGEGYRLCPAAVRMPSKEPSADFFGRREELARLRRPLPPLMSVVGIRGIGKTRLVEEARQDDWVLVRLGGARSDSDLRTAVALAVAGRARSEAVAAVVELLSGAPVVVFDEAEDVVAALRPLVSALLVVPGGPRVLVTSQRPLGLEGEVVWPLPPLSTSDARGLFRHTAGCPDDDRIDELVERLDGHPMAVELAGGWWRPLGWDGLRETLDGHLAELPHPTPGKRSEHRTLATALEWAIQRLDGDALQSLRRLASFQGRVGIAVACTALGKDRVATLSVLSTLVHRHLVRAVPGGWRVLAPVRRVLPPSATDREIHARTIAAVARERSRACNEDPRARADLAELLRDGIAAIEMCIAQHEPVQAASLVCAFAPAFLAHGPFDRLAHWLDLLESAQLPAELEASLLRLGAEAHISRGDLMAGLPALQQVCLAHPEPETWMLQGLVLQLAGAHEDAREAYLLALHADGPATRCFAAAGVAGLDTDEGKPDAALQRIEAALVEARAHRLGLPEAVLVRQQGRALALRGDLADARIAAARAVASTEAFGELRLLFLALRSLAEVEMCLGRHAEVQRCLDHMRRLAVRHPMGGWEALLELVCGAGAVFAGDLLRATSHFDEALAAWGREGIRWAACITHSWVAVVRHRLGEDELVKAHLAAARGEERARWEAGLARAFVEGEPLPQGGGPSPALLRAALERL